MGKLGVVADDFTGACDVGVQFKKHGLETFILASMETLEEVTDFKVVVVDTESRNSSSEDAYNKVRDTARTLKKMGVKIVYKKIDSTLRGNIGAELDSVIDELDLRAVLIAPAYPATNRTTANGKQLLNGTPLDRTEFARDPIDPVKESHIPTLIRGQTHRKVGTINLFKVREGVQPLRKQIDSLIESGHKILVVDAENQNDLRIIARSALDSNVLPCGSAGLAEEVTSWLVSSSPEMKVLVVSGSVNTVTADQISAAQRVLNVQILQPDLTEVLKGGKDRTTEAMRLIEEAEKAAAGGRDIIVRLAESKDRLFEAQQFGKDLGMDYPATAQELLSFLGEVSNAIIDECRISGLILVGGDTAIKVINAIGAYGIGIEKEVLPGIPLGRIFGGRLDGLPTITKAGGFGREDALIQAMRKLKEGL